MRLNLIYLSVLFLIFNYSCNRSVISQHVVPNLTFPEKIVNVKIDSSAFGNGACEPSICINPSDKTKIVGGSILDRVYTSADGGRTWTTSTLSSPYGVYGDPVVRADFSGNFYYAHLSSPGRPWQDESFLDRIVVQTSSDNGNTWNEGSFTAPNGTKDQDKQWMAVDPSNDHIYMTWTEFDKYGDKDPKSKSRIQFAKSTDRGVSWTTPYAISQYEGDCIDGDKTTEGAVPAVGPNGEVYVAWAYDEKIYFDKSLDGGSNWLAEDVVIADQPGGWDVTIPGINRCNGMPITEVDLSDSPYRGHIYVNWSDQRNGEDDTDIWFSKSIDGGLTWSPALRVNDDESGKHQFFTWMDIDPVTGYIYVIFYDRRAYTDTQTDVYLAYSMNGGETFINKKISESPFVPNTMVFFGDYNDISAYDNSIRPIWTRLDGMKLSVLTAIIDLK